MSARDELAHELYQTLRAENLHMAFEGRYSVLAFLDNHAGRPYHNERHVLDVLAAAESLIDGPLSSVMRLAVLFHDVVYEIGSQENERDSFVFFNLAVKFPPDQQGYSGLRQQVSDLIMATTHLEPPRVPSQAIIKDADLWGLGCDYPAFHQNSLNVVREFVLGGADLTVVVDGRTKWLQSMLDKDEIFYTPQGREREKQARANLARELDEISRRVWGTS